jgi:hypothetical protein
MGIFETRVVAVAVVYAATGPTAGVAVALVVAVVAVGAATVVKNSALFCFSIRFFFIFYCEGRKEFAHTTVTVLELISFSKITGAFLFRIFGRFLHVPTTQINCLVGAIISETHIILITIHNTTRFSTLPWFSCGRPDATTTILDGLCARTRSSRRPDSGSSSSSTFSPTPPSASPPAWATPSASPC